MKHASRLSFADFLTKISFADFHIIAIQGLITIQVRGFSGPRHKRVIKTECGREKYSGKRIEDKRKRGCTSRRLKTGMWEEGELITQ